MKAVSTPDFSAPFKGKAPGMVPLAMVDLPIFNHGDGNDGEEEEEGNRVDTVVRNAKAEDPAQDALEL